MARTKPTARLSLGGGGLNDPSCRSLPLPLAIFRDSDSSTASRFSDQSSNDHNDYDYNDSTLLPQDQDMGRGAAATASLFPNSVVQPEPPVTMTITMSNVADFKNQNRRSFKLQQNALTKQSGCISPVSEMIESRASKGPSIPDDDDFDDVEVDETGEDEDYKDLPKVTRTKGSHVRTTVKKGSYLNREGARYQCTSANRCQARFLCILHLPAGTSVNASDAKWTRYEAAKKRNPAGTPHRCPGILLVDRETNRETITVAHECMLALTAKPVDSAMVSGAGSESTERNADPTVSRMKEARSSVGKLFPSIDDDGEDDGDYDDSEDDEDGDGGDEDYEDRPDEACSKNTIVKSYCKGSYFKHQGIPYTCTSNNNGNAKIRCLLYLPGGPFNTASNWTRYPVAKSRTPKGLAPYRCPGALIVNTETNEMTTMVAHECMHAAAAKPSSAGGLKIDLQMSNTNTNSRNKTLPQCQSYMRYQGVPYICSGVSNGMSRHRCFLYRPNVSMATTASLNDDVVWTNHRTAKKRNDGAKPYRCPGILTMDHKKDQTFISVPHECGHLLSTESPLLGPGISSACLQSSAEVQSMKFESIDGLDSDDDDAIVNTNDEDEDEVNSVASDKSFYKGLCARLTEALVNKKNDNVEYKQTIKRLKKENKDLNEENKNINTRLRKANEYKREIKRIKKENKELQEENLKRRSDNNEYKRKIKRLKKENKNIMELNGNINAVTPPAVL